VSTDPQAQPQPSAALYDEGYFTERNAYLAQAEAFRAALAEVVDLAAAYQPHGRLVDIGCGPGLLLEIAAARGYTASGCDVSAWATEHARQRGLDVRTGELAAAGYPTAGFDVAVVNHTLEHIPAPGPFLAEIRRILKPGGILVVGVPNFGGLMAQIMRERWAGLLPDQHLWHFTPDTLRRLLDTAGFAVQEVRVQPHVHRHSHPLKHLLLGALSAFANGLGRGDSLLAVARSSVTPSP
jgi:2-polyprenyl-3-methyl-5-hydroxy-6-metoxy-1,4-benzoquinol methylase